MRALLVLLTLYVLIVVVYGQWGNAEQRKKQTSRLHHEIQPQEGQLPFQKPAPRERKRRVFMQPGMDGWNNAPPGAAEKNKRLRAQKLQEDIL